MSKSNILGILFQVLFIWISLELLLRAFGINKTYMERNGVGYHSYYNQVQPDWFHLRHPGDSGVSTNLEFQYPFRVNKSGTLGDEYTPSQDSNQLDILFLGDSFTEGVGAPNDSSCPELLQQLLMAKGQSTKVFNAGVSGCDPLYSYMFYKHKADTMKFDRVLLMLNTSDLTDLIFRGGMERFHPDGKSHFTKGPVWEPLFKYSYVVRVFVMNILGYNQMLISKKCYQEKVQIVLKELHDCAVLMKNECQPRNQELLFIIQPLPTDQDTIDPNKDDIRDLAPMLTSEGIKCIDIYPQMIAQLNNKPADNYSWPINNHFKGVGYQLLAETIFIETEKKYPGFFSKTK